MTPALSLALTSSPPLLPRVWHGRSVFTAEHVEGLLDNLRAGFSRDRAAHDACGMRSALDAGKALAAACEACPALEREVAAAEAEGRARLRVGAPVDAGADVVGEAPTNGRSGARGADPKFQDVASGTRAEAGAAGQVGDEAVAHAQRPATAATLAQGAAAWREAVAMSAAREAAERAEAAAAAPARSKRASEATDGDVGRLQAFAEDAEAVYGSGMFALYQHQDDKLVAAGIPRTSAWWLFTFRTFFALRAWQPLLQWIVALVGRGGGKSTTLEKLMLVVLLFTSRSVPPTETWQLPYISVRPIDARRRIYETSKLLGLAYGIVAAPTQPLGTYTLALKDIAGNAVEIVSLASTIGNVSGPSTPGCVVDEAAKLQTNPQGANPDGELITSLAETSRARDGWIGVRCSSAWRTTGAHHASVSEGTNLVNFVPCIGVDFIDAALAGLEEVASWEAAQGNATGAAQIRAWAATLTAGSPNVPTWVANPTIPALRSRQLLDTLAKDDPSLEGLDRTTAWLRECASMPLAHDGAIDPMQQLAGLADANAMLAAASRGEQPTRIAAGADVAPMKLRGMRPNDARYDNRDANAGPWVPPSWDKGDVF